MSNGAPANRHNKNNLANFNEQDYCYSIVLENQDGKIVKFRPEAIEELVIEDTLMSIYSKGHIIIRNDFEALERTTETAKATFVNAEAGEYFFRGDGRDLLTIDIFPHFDNNALRLKHKDWLIHITAVVYDVEDIPTPDSGVKLKKLYFWDTFYQKLLDQNLEWSTANIAAQGSEKAVEKLTNQERSVPTGKAIATLLRDAGFADSVDESLIDQGHPDNKVFYTSPSQNFAIDDLLYLLHRHVSEKDSEPCLFRQERADNEAGAPQLFSLKPLSYYFERAGKSDPGEFQNEHFFIQERADDQAGERTMFLLPRAPLDKGNSLNKDVKMTGFNSIFAYRFTAMSGIDNNKALTNRPVYSYSSPAKQFNFELQDHTVQKAITDVDTRLASLLKQEGSQNMMVALNQPQLTGYNTSPSFSVIDNKEGRKAAGINKIVLASLLLNHTIDFVVRGLTIRQSGRFIGIDKMHQFVDSEFDHKLLGQWFVTKVVHRFYNRIYENHIFGVKMHSYKLKNKPSQLS